MHKPTIYEKYLKRFLDFILALLGFIFLSPLLLIISILIKLDSKGPILFKQERIGYQGKTFSIYKFRTMVEGAEKIGDGLSLHSSKDPRITKVGNALRKTSLDELPQLLNIIKGDMSFIGPRPPVTYHPYKGYHNYPEEYKKRFEVRPGLGGLAQVVMRNTGTWEERFVYDIEYVNNISLNTDMKMILKTVIKVFRREDIYGGEVSEKS